jgi:hypothetical protein
MYLCPLFQSQHMTCACSTVNIRCHIVANFEKKKLWDFALGWRFWKYGVSRSLEMAFSESSVPYIRNRSESDWISEPKYSFRNGLIKDRTSISEIKWINYPRIVARMNYPCIYQSIITVVAALFVWYFNWTSLCQLLDIYFLLLYLFKHFNLNEKFILLKNSSDRIGLEFFFHTRIGFGLDNFGSDFKH